MSGDILVYVDRRLESLIPGFLARQQNNIAALRVALDQQNYDELLHLGHQMKGSCGGYGLTELSEFARGIESAAQVRDTNILRRNIGLMQEYLAHVRIEYRNIWNVG